MKKRGSAILIAVFLVAAVGSVAFGIGRMFLAESNLANIYESSTVAYYAAESGIEEGFLRYRYGKNTEVPNSASNVSANNLDATTQSDTTLASFYNTVSDNIRYYTLTMKYKADYYGDADAVTGGGLTEDDLNSTNYPPEYNIPRDEAIKIDISDVINASGGSQDVTLFLLPNTCGSNPFFAEVKLIGTTPLNNPTEWKIALVEENADALSYGFPANSYLASSTPVANVLKYSGLIANTRLKTSSPIFDSPNNKVELYFKPINCSAKIGLDPTGINTKIAGPFSTVKSTGYYGGVTRTLEAKIDRQAGTVYDLFDFVLYKK